MIRPSLPQNFNYKTNDIVFQIVDWKDYDIYCESDESDDLEEELSDEEKPKKHFLRILKFLNYDDMTALEIVCEDIHIRKIK